MRCGAKCFHVEMDVDGDRKAKKIIARTPAEAIKFTRHLFGENINIVTVRKEKNKR